MPAHPHPAIVVAAWNRPQSLQRLLDSLAKGHYQSAATLHVSIDYHHRKDVVEVAEAFHWAHGEKVIECHPENLGLRKHILHCGGLTKTYGAIILLEDDLLAAPFMYDYACESLAFFANSESIAGISLYHYQVAESCHQPFDIWEDGSDNYFLQLPSSWGAVFSAQHWDGFIEWMTENHSRLPKLPQYIQTWSKQSWKKLYAAYLIGSNKYFSFPKHALTTNTEDFGVHANTAGLFQVPLMMGKKDWKMTLPAATELRYDAWFEPNAAFLKSIQPGLKQFTFEVDLLGQKLPEHRGDSFVLTAQKGGEAELGYAKAGFSNMAAVWAGRSGNDIRLIPAKTELQSLNPQDVEFRYYGGASKAALLHVPEVRMPGYTLIYVAKGEEVELGFDSLLNQTFAGLEIVVLAPKSGCRDAIWAAHCEGRIRLMEYGAGKAWEGIQKAVAAATGPLIQIIEEGASLPNGIVEKVAKIFRQFPDLEWLTGLPKQVEGKALSMLISNYRWDTDRFGASAVKTEGAAERSAKIETEIATWLPISLQVFRRDFWMREQAETANVHAKLRNLSRYSLPKVAALQLAKGALFDFEGFPRKRGLGRVNKTRSYYHKHIPLLWKLHRKWSDYPVVLRFDPSHQTWYEFDY